MRVVQMNAYNMEGNGSAEANQLVGDGKHVVREGVANGGQRGVSEENKLANDLQMEDVNGVSGMPDQSDVEPQGLHQQRQFIHWERFLHVRTLKVLLVENDDSTRHIVSALLRNCSYEVIAVSNGLQAWKLLEDINNQIDLVLSEVVMPVLSGIGLLSKIMSHKTRKTTPVIMTSSHDAMGVVFKCLSKGAVDFLAKPIRKNELKNLWQHVWRKCHSSSGSGSESGVQNQKSMRSRSGDEESENSGSREEYDDRSIDLLRHDGSDNGSGTQSSWTKKAVDVESPQPMSSWEQLSDPPDSTCAQVIHSRSEAFASSWVPTSAKEHKELKQCENVATDKNIQVGSTGSQKTQNSLHELKKSLVKVTGDDENLAAPDNNEAKIFNSTDIGAGSENRKGDRIRQTADLNGIIISNCDTCKGSSESKLPCSISPSCKTNDEAEKKAKDLPSLELTLKRGVDVDVQPTAPDQNTLRHSELAFTRYPDGSGEKQTPTGIVGSCSPVENSSDAAKTDSPQNLRSDTPPNQASNGSSNNNDMGSTTYRSFTKPAEIIDKPSAKTTSSAVDCANPSIVQPVKDGLQSVTQNDKIDAGPKHTVLGKSGGVGQEVQVQHHYHHHHHVHCLPQRNQGQKRDESSPKNMLAAQDCGSSRKVRRGVEVNIPNGSASSNHGSNLQNGSSTAVNGEGTNMVNDNWAAAKGEAGVGCGSGSGSGTGLDQDLSAQREAPLNKICQKRKERFFEKRVRHQTRKKVAEERPHVRGEFVHQVQKNNVQENKSKDADT